MRYRIGDLVLDTDRFELTQDGAPVAVEPQVFQVLAYLVEHRHRVVPKEELLDEVWTTRFVTESALTSRIKSARRALGDDGHRQHAIKTVFRQGYRFVGSVTEVDDEPDEPTGPTEPTDRVQPDRRLPRVPEARLPRFGNTLRGRQHELAEVTDLLDRHTVLTLVGPGGTGKTRLAVAVAGQGHQGLEPVFVDLAAVGTPGAVSQQLAASLGVQTGQREAALAACCEYLSAVPHLLVIDNCEHVIDAAAEAVAAIAGQARRCRLLCTSREPLGVHDEQVYRLGPLATLPIDADATRQSVLDTASGSLFDDRARRADHSFELTDDVAPAVARLCRELDGLPLAIELAAGRVTTLSLDDLLSRLDRRLDLLVSPRRAVADRHRTLRATVEWSYDTIRTDAQRLLRYLAVFPAGVTLETAEAIGRQLGLATDTLDLVSCLVDASLLRRHDGRDGARYVQLETLRAFGLDRLDHHGERIHALDLAASWALDLVARMNAELLSEAEPTWAARMRLELPNLRVARQHLVDGDRLDDLVELSVNLHEWARFRDVAEPWSWADELVEAATGRDDEVAARAHAIAAQGAWRRGEIERTRALATRAIEIEQRHPDVWSRARARSELAVAELFAGEVTAAITHWLARVEIDPHAPDLANAAFASAYSGDVDRARALAAEARELAAASGSPSCIAWAAYATGEVEYVAGSGRHGEWLARAVELADTVGSDFTRGVAQVTLATSLAASGDLAGAAATYHRLVDHWLRSGSWTQQWTTLRNAAVLLEPHAPDIALAIVVAAEADPFSPALSPEAELELGGLRRRLTSELDDERVAEVTDRAATVARHEVAQAARTALELLIDAPVHAARGSATQSQ